MCQQIDRIVFYVERGWHPFTGQVEAGVYHEIECPAPLFAKWLYEGQRAEEAVCIGCDRGCQVSCQQGFNPAPKRQQGIHRKNYFTLSQQEMVRKFSLLRVDQAAYCLNVSERKIYDLVAWGKLIATKDKPVRIAAESVKAEMNNLDA